MPFFISSAPAAFVYPWQFIAGSWALRIHLGSTKRLSEMLLSKHLPNMVQSWHVIQIACENLPAKRDPDTTLEDCSVFEKSFICWCLRHGCSHWHDRPRSFWTIWCYLSPSMDLMLECFLFICPHVSGHFDLAFTLQVKQHKFYVISFHIFSHVF